MRFEFKIVRNLYDVKNLFEYTKSIQTKGDLNDEQTPGSPSFYNDPQMRKLQFTVLRKMEDETDLRLFPTYTYFRIYNSFSQLSRHKDRPACEISATINLGYDGDYNWPVCIKDKFNKEHEVVLEPSDGLLYRGCELEHWREPADSRIKCQSQVFVHYVDQNGPYTDCLLDIRREL